MGTWVSKAPGIPYSHFTSYAITEVQDKFQDSYTRVNEAQDDLNDFSAQLTDYINGLHKHYDSPDYDFDISRPDSADIDNTYPSFDSYNAWPVSDTPAYPQMGTLVDLDTVVLDDIPKNTVNNPAIELPRVPTLSEIDEPGQQPEVDLIELPIVPEFTMPDDPVITEITVDDAPDVEVPQWTAEAPVDDLEYITLPDFDYSESVYSSEIWMPLIDKVKDGIENGGTGLDADVENLIFDSARYRQEGIEEEQLDKVKTHYTAKNFDRPSGSLDSAVSRANAEVARNKTELNSKIAIEQAELAQKNTHFMLDKGISLEQITVGFFDAQSNRLLEAEKVSAEVVSKSSQLMIERYNTRAQVYNITAQAYEQELKAAFADLEAYKIEMEGKKIASDVQKNVVDIYTAQVGALEAQAGLYTAQVNGAKVAADVERLKIENYQISVQAYVARLEGEKIKFSLYATTVDAEKTKIEAYSEQIKAYLGEVSAVKAQNDGKIQQLEVTLSSNNSLIDKYKADVIGFDSKIKEIASENDVAIKVYQAGTDRMSAESNVVTSKNDLAIKDVSAQIEAERLKLDGSIAEINAMKDSYVALMGLEGEARLGIFNATAQLMSSAMTSVSASASMGDSNSRSMGLTESLGNTLSEQHSYNIS